MATLSQLTGSTGTDPAVETTPIVDGTIRGALLVVVNACVGALATFGVDLSGEQVAAIVAILNGLIVFGFALFDKWMAARASA
jgi:hypothetical protein